MSLYRTYWYFNIGSPYRDQHKETVKKVCLTQVELTTTTSKQLTLN